MGNHREHLAQVCTVKANAASSITERLTDAEFVGQMK